MDTGTRSFTELADKALTADVKIASWCPTMDLLALSTADGQLCLHRLNWQRLWAVSPESAVTSLCWRPDGKVLACGYEDGFISLLDVENGETMQRGKMVAGADQLVYTSVQHALGILSNLLNVTFQALLRRSAGLKSNLTTSHLMVVLLTKHAQHDFAELQSLLHQPQVQLRGRSTTRVEQNTSSGLFCQRDWT